MYPKRKPEAKSKPYHLIANGPMLKISGSGFHGITRKCIIRVLIQSKVENYYSGVNI
jgi:hypothetical protein